MMGWDSELHRVKEELRSTGHSGWMIGCGRFLLIVLAFAVIGRALHAFAALLSIGILLAFLVTAMRWFRGRI